MRVSEQSPYGVNGFSTLLVAIVQFAPFSINVLASVTPRITECSAWRPALKRSVAGSTASETPDWPSRLPTAACSLTGIKENLEPWPNATRPCQPILSVVSQTCG